MALQRRYGNQWVQQLLNPSQSITIQPKLTLGHPDTPSEREADRAAHHIAAGRPLTTPPTPVTGPHPPVSPQIESTINQARGSGHPLPDHTRTTMEHQLGTNLTDVRVHTDTRAHALNQTLNANAFTTGTDIFFSHGTYNPTSTTGRSLLAHELTHVAQQTASPTAPAQRSGPAEVIQRVVKDSKGEVLSKGDVVKRIVAHTALGAPAAGELYEEYRKRPDITIGGLLGIARLRARWQPLGDGGALAESEAGDEQEAEEVHAVDEVEAESEVEAEEEPEEANEEQAEEALRNLAQQQQLGATVIRGDMWWSPLSFNSSQRSTAAPYAPLLPDEEVVGNLGPMDTDARGNQLLRYRWKPTAYPHLNEAKVRLHDQAVFGNAEDTVHSFPTNVMDGPNGRGYRFSATESADVYSVHTTPGDEFLTATPRKTAPRAYGTAINKDWASDHGMGRNQVGEHDPQHTATHYPGTPAGGSHRHFFKRGGWEPAALEAMLQRLFEHGLFNNVPKSAEERDPEADAFARVVMARARVGLQLQQPPRTEEKVEAGQPDPQRDIVPAAMFEMGLIEKLQHTGPQEGLTYVKPWLEQYEEGVLSAPEKMNCWQAVLVAAFNARAIDEHYLRAGLAETVFQHGGSDHRSARFPLAVAAKARENGTFLEHPAELTGSAAKSEWFQSKLPDVDIARGDVIVLGSKGEHVCLSLGGGKAREHDSQGKFDVEGPGDVEVARLTTALAEIEQRKIALREEKQQNRAARKDAEAETLIELNKKFRSLVKEENDLGKAKRELTKQLKLAAKKPKAERKPNELRDVTLEELVSTGRYGFVDALYWAPFPEINEIEAILIGSV